MESSQILGFLKILSESMKVGLRNVKLITSITTLSLLLTSILFFLFSFSYEIATNFMITSTTDSTSTSAIFFLQIVTFLALLFGVELTFIFSCIAISHTSGIATVIVAATSYTGGSKLSLRDLFSSVRTKWRSPFTKSLRASRNPVHLLAIVAVAVAVPLVMLNPNPFTVAIASVVGVSISVLHLHASVVPALAAVVVEVEDGCDAAEATERAEKLVEGQRLQGFMANVMFNALGLIALLSFWMVLGDQGSRNLTVYGFFFLNCASLTRIFVGVVYTVYYFRCKEYHGEKIQLFALSNFNYTALVNHIP